MLDTLQMYLLIPFECILLGICLTSSICSGGRESGKYEEVQSRNTQEVERLGISDGLEMTGKGEGRFKTVDMFLT